MTTWLLLIAVIALVAIMGYCQMQKKCQFQELL